MPKRKAARSQRVTRSQSRKFRVCHLDRLPKESLDVVLEFLRVPVSSQRDDILDKGLPRNELHPTNQWCSIASGIAALASLARTAHRYQAAVMPHLHVNLMMPLKPPDPAGAHVAANKAILRRIEADHGPDCAFWPLSALRATKVTQAERTFITFVSGFILNRSYSHFTIRLDIRNVSWDDYFLDVLQSMPHLIDVGISTRYDGVREHLDGRLFGRTLRKMKYLKSLTIDFGQEFTDVVEGISAIKVDLDRLSLFCTQTGPHRHHHRGEPNWQSWRPEDDEGAADVPPQRDIALRNLHIKCRCKHAVEELLWMLEPSQLQTLCIGSLLDAQDSLTHTGGFRRAAAHTSRIEVSLSVVEDMQGIALARPDLKDLTINWLSKDSLVEDIWCFMRELPPSLETLRFPHVQPYMLLVLTDVLPTLDHQHLHRIVVGTESLQFTAAHWTREYKVRVPTLLKKLGTACWQQGMRLEIETSLFAEAIPWKTWFHKSWFAMCGADGEAIHPLGRSVQYELWQAWLSLKEEEEGRPRDARFDALWRRLSRLGPGESLTTEEWDAEQFLLDEHDMEDWDEGDE